MTIVKKKHKDSNPKTRGQINLLEQLSIFKQVLHL